MADILIEIFGKGGSKLREHEARIRREREEFRKAHDPEKEKFHVSGHPGMYTYAEWEKKFPNIQVRWHKPKPKPEPKPEPKVTKSRTEVRNSLMSAKSRPQGWGGMKNKMANRGQMGGMFGMGQRQNKGGMFGMRAQQNNMMQAGNKGAMMNPMMQRRQQMMQRQQQMMKNNPMMQRRQQMMQRQQQMMQGNQNQNNILMNRRNNMMGQNMTRKGAFGQMGRRMNPYGMKRGGLQNKLMHGMQSNDQMRMNSNMGRNNNNN